MPSARGSSTSTCACGPTALGPAGLQPGELLHVLCPGRRPALSTSGSPSCGCAPWGGQGIRTPGGEAARRDGLLGAEHRPCRAAGSARPKQAQEKIQRGRLNAKFSPGALVDLEYAVQILQVTHGAAEAKPAHAADPRGPRRPGIHRRGGKGGSGGAGVRLPLLPSPDQRPADAAGLGTGPRSPRPGLRRIPPPGPAHGLSQPSRSSAPRRSSTWTSRRTARRCARSWSDTSAGTPPRRSHGHRCRHRPFDAVPEEPARGRPGGKRLRESRPGPSSTFDRSPGRADRRPLFARLATLASDVLAQQPDPDMALNNWERFLHALPDPAAHLRQMLSQPMRLEILLSIFSASQFLADTLVRDPELLTYIGRKEVLNVPRGAAEIRAELSRISSENADRGAWMDALRTLPPARNPAHRRARHLPGRAHAAHHGGAVGSCRRGHPGNAGADPPGFRGKNPSGRRACCSASSPLASWEDGS